MNRDGNHRIQRLRIASRLLEDAEQLGLHDVKKWVSVEEAQNFIDRERWIAFEGIDESDKICGVGAIGVEEEGRLWIELIVVSDMKRRMGIASSIVEQMIEWGMKNQYRAIFVDVDDDNQPALNFYKSMGFKNAGRIFEYYYDSSAAVVLMKRL